MTSAAERGASISVCSLALLFAVIGCDRREQVTPTKTKNLNELKQATAEMSDEELEKARKVAGWKSNDELLADAKDEYERTSKIYIKTRIANYRKLVDDIRKQVGAVEKEASSWQASKDPQKAVASFSARAKKEKTAILARYDEITAKGTEGGNTQVALADAIATWEALLGQSSTEMVESQSFDSRLAEVRKKLDAVSKTLDAIEKDATLVAAPGG